VGSPALEPGPLGKFLSCSTTLELLESLTEEFRRDRYFCRALANEFFRVKRYQDAQESFDRFALLCYELFNNTDHSYLGVICSYCSEDIFQVQYKCRRCDVDFNMCTSCYTGSKHEHPEDLRQIPCAEIRDWME